MFNAEFTIGDSTQMAIGFDTGFSGNWLNTNSDYEVLSTYSPDSSNSATGNTLDLEEDLTSNYVTLGITWRNLAGFNYLQGIFKIFSDSEEISFEFVSTSSFANNNDKAINGLAAWEVEERILSDGIFGLSLENEDQNFIKQLYTLGIIEK